MKSPAETAIDGATARSGPPDAIVVGSGPGGATVARELARRGRRVLILEWGTMAPVTGSLGQALRELGVPGRGLLLAGRAMPVVRAITTGGSSIYYYATAFDPPQAMLQRHGIDLARQVAEVKDELAVAPLPPELLGPLADRIMESAQSLGHPWQPLPKFLRQEHLGARAPMGFYSAPSYEAKWNARMFVEDAVRDGAVLQTGARVRRVLSGDGAVRGVEVERHGKRERIEAPLVVVAAGGIGSPLILRASGLSGAGHDFFYDPLVVVMGTAKDIRSRQEQPMQCGAFFAEQGYMLADMMTARPLYSAFAAQVGRLDRLGAYASTMQLMVKIRDQLGGRLTARGLIRKPLSAADHQKLSEGTAQARSILSNAGARQIFRSWYFAAHPGGTVKIGDLLDSNLQSEISNLYVCDASVIPEAWGRPPTLTLLALGKRLAEHLTGGAGS